MVERRRNAAKRAAFEKAWAELKRRLASICAQLSDEELARLTSRMTRLRLKYEGVWDSPNSPPIAH